jgi:predicted nucleic acid-binding protein
VILIDANILIYAHLTTFSHHDRARRWLDQQLNAPAPVGLPWISLLAFLRLVTNPRVFEHPESIGDAWQQLWKPASGSRPYACLKIAGGAILAADFPQRRYRAELPNPRFHSWSRFLRLSSSHSTLTWFVCVRP